MVCEAYKIAWTNADVGTHLIQSKVLQVTGASHKGGEPRRHKKNPTGNLSRGKKSYILAIKGGVLLKQG